jgi:nicotinamide riboside kinase
MAVTVETVAQEALGLSSSGRALLVEKLLASLAGESNPVVERANLDEVRRRRAAVHSGKAGLVDGPEALRQARAALGVS